jgi:tail assembly chaperone
MAHNELVLPSFEKVIDGETYEIRMLDGVVGFRLYTRLLQCAGAALKELGKIDTKGDHTELAARAVCALLAGLPPELYEEARALFAESTTLHKSDGKKPALKHHFGNHFAGRYAHLSKWMIECFKVNFADFLDESGPLSSLFATLAKASPSPKGSTGSPTES